MQWYGFAGTLINRLRPSRFLLPEFQAPKPSLLPDLEYEQPIPAHLLDEVAYIRIFKGAPLSILLVLTLMDLTLNVRQLCALTGNEPE